MTNKDIIKWKNYIYNFINDTDLTHLAFNGGKYKVPDNKYEEFYKNYYEQLVLGNTELFIIEKVQNCRFAYFLDIEVPKGDSTILTKTEVNYIIEKMNEIINESFNENKIKLTENIISKRVINIDLTKYHINYPNLIVTSNIAQAITKKLITK